MHVLDANRTKWDPKSRECIFLGYSEEAKGCNLFYLVTKKVLVNCDVVYAKQLHQMEEEASFLDI